ncbi:MAG: FAD-binding oxidoreductase [Hyphomicrobiales bacterium]|nr:FAD-binding oxidoreductase [Hyphomicrobiales bacterium]
MSDTIFHRDFKPMPYWWEAWRPNSEESDASLPSRASVAIVGAGYAGLSAAIELSDNGIDACVVEANDPGFGASTRNGGAVSGGVNVGKSFSGKSIDPQSDRAARMISDAADAFSLIERIIEREEIACCWEKRGRFVGAWAPKHYEAMAHRVDLLNRAGNSGCTMLPRERQREEIASDYYHGGMVVERSGKLHPALYYKGLLDAARRRKIKICGKAPVAKITRQGTTWRLETARGEISADEVVIATNGYTGNVTPRLKRRVIPIASHIIATEELAPELAASLFPRGRTVSDTRRVLCYYRMSPDGKRMIFGGRARFTPVSTQTSAPILHRFMLDRFPQLRGVRVTHAWTGNVAFTLDAVPHMGREEMMHYALGCNGSGVAMMTYLGYQTGRKIAGRANVLCAFDVPEFPEHPLYDGNPWFLPLVGGYYRVRDYVDRLLS